ncbi:MAG: CPBP family intramembrane metalloprotease [Cytophagales bacterium]|nr:CPBP family intramembrane metalloprotease [Cytophagales bacterium]
MTHQLFRFIALAYGYSWAIWLIPISLYGTDQIDGRVMPYILAGSFGPALSALFVTYKKEGIGGLKRLLSKFVVARFSWVYYLASLFILPLVALLVTLLLRLDAINPAEQGLVYLTIAIGPLNGLFTIFGGIGPLGEELGWRGYLQPSLNKWNNDLLSSVVIGPIWAAWHFPIFFFPEFRNGIGLVEMCIFYPMSMIFISYSMTKIWKWTRGSVFMAMWFHGIVNVLAALILRAFDFNDWPNLLTYNVITGIFLITALVYGILDRYIGTNPALSQQKTGVKH